RDSGKLLAGERCSGADEVVAAAESVAFELKQGGRRSAKSQITQQVSLRYRRLRVALQRDLRVFHRSADNDLDVDRFARWQANLVSTRYLKSRVDFVGIRERRGSTLDVEPLRQEGVFAALAQQHTVQNERLLRAVDVYG